MITPPARKRPDWHAKPRPRPKNPEARRALGEVVRAFREQRGWTQEHLALRAGFERAWVGQLERGQRWPTLESVWYILDALGVAWEEFGAAMSSKAALRATPQPRHAGGDAPHGAS